MSMLWLQGFDQYQSIAAIDLIADKNAYASLMGFTEFSGYAGSAQVRLATTSTDFRVAGKSMQLQQITDNAGFRGINAIRKAFANSDPVVVFGFAFKNTIANFTVAEPIAYLGNAPGGAAYRNNVVVGYNTSGAIVLYGNIQWPLLTYPDTTIAALTPTAASPVGVISINNWHYVEVKVDYSTSPNTVSVYVDNELVLTHASNVYSSNGSGADDPITSIACVRSNSGFSGIGSTYFDDMYLLNGEGAYNNDVLGPQRVSVYAVNGAGASAEWSVVGAPSNFEAVDDATYNPADTSYVQSTALNQQDYYALSNAEAGFTAINAVQLSAFGRTTTGTGTVRLKGAIGVDEAFSDGSVNSSVFSEVTAVLDVAPGGSAWTEALFNSMQIGIENI